MRSNLNLGQAGVASQDHCIAHVASFDFVASRCHFAQDASRNNALPTNDDE